MRTCRIEVCERAARVRGLCKAHYARLRNGLRLDSPIASKERKCGVDGCGRPHSAKGYCVAHYERHRLGKALDAPVQRYTRPTKICSIEDCGRKHYGKGYCKTHYERARKGEPINAPITSRRRLCSVSWCDKTARKGVSGYCVGHYKRHLKGQDLDLPFATDRIRAKVGDLRPLKKGYTKIKYGPDQRDWMAHHRYVAEQSLGRKLLPGETVHHRNGIRHDNRIENLELWASRHRSGQRVSDLLRWAKEIVQRYDGVQIPLFE